MVLKIDKRKFIDAHPIGALGYTKLKVDLYKRNYCNNQCSFKRTIGEMYGQSRISS